MSRIPSLFKTPKPKKFSFATRFYDENKEQLQARIAKIKKEVREETTDGPNPLKGSLKSEWKRNSHLKESKASNLRVALIAVVLGIIAYLYLKS